MNIFIYNNVSLPYSDVKTYDIENIKYIVLSEKKENSYILCRCLPEGENLKSDRCASIYTSENKATHRVVIIAMTSKATEIAKIIASYSRALTSFPI